MSERTDRIENALGSDWATTRQMAERRVTEGGPSGRVAEWRRRA